MKVLRSPQQEQQMMMAQLEEEYGQYVDEMIQIRQEDSTYVFKTIYRTSYG